MAKKPSITTVASGYQSTTTINDNFQNLRNGFDNTLSLDGSSPNAMQADFDMNSNDILNVKSISADELIIDNLNLSTVVQETAAYATAAAASYDSFDDRYLGAKSTAPTLDNDGNALLTGAIYWNTTSSQMFVWNGSTWINYEATSVAASNTATTQAGIATTQAGTATTQAGIATTQAGLAATAKTAAETARDAAYVNANVYANTTDGLAAVALGGQFQVVSGTEIIRYREDAGPVATEVARYPAASVFNLGPLVLGTGDRTSSIKVTSSTSAFFSGTGNNLVDGDKTASSAGGVQFTGSNVGRTVTFDFGVASRLVFNSVRLWWNGARNQGVIKAQGSIDGVTWTDISGNLNWGQSLTSSGSAFYQDFALTKMMNGPNQIGYRYFRIAGVSGSAVAIEWLLEVEFETTEALDHNSIAEMAPVGTAGYVLAKATGSAGDVYWRKASEEKVPSRMFADIERLLASERYSEARFHADSVYGLDANDGLSSARAKKTITGLMAMSITKDSVIGLRSGATFNDKTIEPASGFKKLIGFGDGSLALLDCAPAIAPASFTASSGTAGTYEITLTREAGGITYVNDPQYTMWEVALDGTRRELVPRTSAALVLANPGSVYFVNRSSASTLAYVLPFGSTDPRSDGKTYKASILKAGVGVNGDSGGTTNPAYDGQYIEGIHASGQVDGHGSILSGDDTTMKRCLASYGNKHNIIFKSGYAEDSIAYGWGSNPVGGCIPWTVFRFDAKGRKARLTRCMSIATQTEKGGSAFYCHGSLSPDGLDFDEVILNQFVIVDAGGIESSAKTQRYRDVLSLNLPGSTTPVGGISARALQPVCEIDRLIFWGIRSTGTVVNRPSAVPAGSPSTANILSVRSSVLAEQPGSGTVSGGLLALNESCTYNIERNVFLSQNNRSISISGSGSLATGAGSTITRNIFLGNRATNPQAVNFMPAVANLTVDYNVYVRLQNTQIQIINSETNTTYTMSDQAGFDTYKTATGMDANSIFISRDAAETLFMSGVTGALAGDLRLNPNCPLLFTDGSRVVDNAGPSEHLDWNRRTILPGAPSSIPRPPMTLAESEAYCRSPAEWNWYP